MATTTERPRKTIGMKPEEIKAFVKWVEGFAYDVDAYTELGVSPVTYGKLKEKMSGPKDKFRFAPDTIAKIRAKIGQAA